MNTVCVFAHPDDEVIFGFPMLKQAKHIICCSNDINNPLRVWCKNRVQALYEIGKLIGAKITCFDYDSEFYRANVRDGSLNDLAEKITQSILETNAGMVFTHNEWGEYGHLDHILVHRIAKATGWKILVTDIAVDGGWFKVNNLYLKKDPLFTVENDLDFYNKCKAIYDKINCWTWSKEPVKSAGIYESNHSTL